MASATETPGVDGVLIDALPEKALPELQAILAKAMINAPRVMAAGLDVDMSETSVKLARSPMLPSASGAVNAGEIYERYQYPVSGTSTSHTLQALTYNAGISQPLYHWGALKKGYQSAQLQRAIADRNLGETRRLLAIDVRRAYFDLISVTNARETERVGLENLEKDCEFLKQQAADGFVIQRVVDDATANITAYKLQMKRSEDSYQARWASFRLLTGIETLQPADILPKVIPAITPKLGEALKELTEQPGGYLPANLANADDGIRSEQLNYEIVKTRLRPQLGLGLSASQDNRNPDNNALGQKQLVTSYSAYASVNWNVFDGFATQALKQRSLIRLRQLKTARDQAERDYHESLKNQNEALRDAWQPLQRTEQWLVEQRSNVALSQKDFEAGFVPKQALDGAKIAADNAQQATNNVRAAYYMQIVNYLSLRGEDPAATLAPKH